MISLDIKVYDYCSQVVICIYHLDITLERQLDFVKTL